MCVCVSHTVLSDIGSPFLFKQGTNLKLLQDNCYNSTADHCVDVALLVFASNTIIVFSPY